MAGTPLTDGHNFQNHKSCVRGSHWLTGVQVFMADVLKGEESAVLT